MDWGGHIYVDGTGTKRNPYHCDLEMAPEQQRGIVVQKSVNMKGLKTTPYISCSSGFLFAKSTSQAPSIVLSGLVLWQTPVVVQDCDLKILNCFFQHASTVLSVHITNHKSRYLNIPGSAFFKNNASCVEIIFHNDARDQGQFLIIDISKTKFVENGFHKRRSASGVVTIQSQTTQSSSINVQISCFNVISVKNYGYFINLDLPFALTDEVYNDVRLFNNIVKASADEKTRHVVNSLYNSNIKKTRVKFNNLRSSHNYLLRCIRINSEEAQVEIQSSLFIGQRLTNERGGAMFFNATARGAVVIFNSRFRRNIAKGGGALFAHSKNGTLTLNITKVYFTECGAETYGCAILVGDLKSAKVENGSATYKLIASLSDINVRDCFDLEPKCYIIRFDVFSGKVVITNSSWKNGKTSTPEALMISNTGGNNDVTISGCTFFVNHRATRRSVVAIEAQNRQAAGSVTIVNSFMSNQQVRGLGDFWISQEFSIYLINVVLASFAYSLVIAGLFLREPSVARPFHVSISNCSFLDNTFDILAKVRNANHVELSIKNTIFRSRQMTHKNVGLYVILRPLEVINNSSAFVEMHNVTFESKPCNVLGLLFQGNKTVQIQKSV